MNVNLDPGSEVLVTGGAGFIGSHVVDRLVKEDYSVRVIDDLSTGKIENIREHLNSGKVTFAKGDIRDVSFVRDNLRGMSAVIHFAAMVSVPLSIKNPNLTFDVNLLGTLNLLKSCVEAQISRFVFISSCAVCGDPATLPVSEETPPNPISPYAESKLIGERYCLGFHERGLLSSVVLRFFNVYGPRQGMNDYSGVITRYIDRISHNEPLIIYGDGLQTRDFVNVSDIASAVLAATNLEDATGQVINVGSGKPTSINELAKTLLELSGKNLEIIHEKSRLGDIKDSYANISKAQKLLFYKPQFLLSKGLSVLLEENGLAH